MPIRVTFAGESWRTDDLTLAEAVRIEQATGRSWIEINPYRSAVDARAVMAAFLARSMGQDAALEKVESLTISEALEAFSSVESDLPDAYEDGRPLSEADGTTTPSSGSPESSGGPQT